MAHEDQFTATGPAFTGAGFERAAFSTGREGTDSTYGVNVEGSVCGLFGKCVKEASSSRDADVEGVGVFGKGDIFGVYGQGNTGLVGVIGTQNNIHRPNHDGVGVLGAVMRGGTGVIGVSLSSLGPLIGQKKIPNPADPNADADGEGVGVFGASGSGTGVRGTSRQGVGIFGSSLEGDGIVGSSEARGKSGVFGFHDSTGGAAFGVSGTAVSRDGAGVNGFSDDGNGVRGFSKTNDAVFGLSTAEDKSGVSGLNAHPTGATFGVSGTSVSPDGVGVNGSSDTGVGVKGTSKTNDGVVGLSNIELRSGVFGENKELNERAYGVTGSCDSPKGAGIRGISDDGYGGDFRGGLAPLRLVPAKTPGHPTKGNHQSGEFFVDSDGELFFCKKGGTPGDWFRVRLAPV